MAPRTCSPAAYNQPRHWSRPTRSRLESRQPYQAPEMPHRRARATRKAHKPGEEGDQSKNPRGGGGGLSHSPPNDDPFELVAPPVRFSPELQFASCRRVVEARRYGSLSAHEIANR